MKKKEKNAPPPPATLPLFVIRGQRVILDADLARIYGVPTHVFNQAIKRNQKRFPEDFAFQLTLAEVANLRSQFVTSSLLPVDFKDNNGNFPAIMVGSASPPDAAPNLTSQFVISSSEHAGIQGDKDSLQPATKSYGGRRTPPWAFTEHGALMAANLLRSEQAVRMSVYVVRAFVGMREQLAANAAILKRLAEIDKTLLEQDTALRTIWTELQPLLAPPPVPSKRRMGFHDPEAKA